MGYRVGPKGQIVIDKEIRDRLGIQPGWTALQLVADDHIEVYFLPPEHTRSLKGVLARYATVQVPPGEAWDRARDQAWEAAAWEEERPFLRGNQQ